VIVVEKSARVGYTLLLAIAALYWLVHESAAVAFVSQNEEKVVEWIKTTFDPILLSSPKCRKIIRRPKKGEKLDELRDRYFANGAILRCRTAASDDAFRGYRMKRGLADEYDANAWRPIGPNSIGDKLGKFKTRHAEYHDGGISVGSTPTHLSTSLIHREIALTDIRRYFVPCPHCSGATSATNRDDVGGEVHLAGWQVLEFGDGVTPYGIKFSLTEAHVVDQAWYQCRHCGREIHEIDPDTGYSWKLWLDRHGEWRPTNGEWCRGDRPGEWIPVQTSALPARRGFHVWSGMSCANGVTWRAIVERFLTAKRAGAAELQDFQNEWLGLPWEPRAVMQQAKADAIRSRLVSYPAEVPDDVVHLVATTDLQKGREDGSTEQRLETSVVGFGRMETAFLIGHWTIPHPVPSQAAFEALDAIFEREFRTASGRRLKPLVKFVDSGWATQAVYEYTGPRVGKHVYAIKGIASTQGLKAEFGILSRTATADPKRGVGVYKVDTLTGKETLEFKLMDGPVLGGIVLPKSAALVHDYLPGLTSEKPIRVGVAGTKWEPTNRRITGESRDCMVYALAARELAKRLFPVVRDINAAADALGIPGDLTVSPDADIEDMSAQAVEIGGRIVTATQKPQAPANRPVRKPVGGGGWMSRR
jgi:phage terminase large subunit GpA-like protein